MDISFFSPLSMTWWLLLIGSSGLHLALLGLLRVGWWRNKRTENRLPTPDAWPPLSVVVAARNEAPNLAQHLPAICEQDYPHYEVIVALNQTDDQSVALLTQLQARYPQLRWLDLGTPPTGWAAKKWALQQAAASAQHAQLVYTDADCAPEPQWLRHVAIHLSGGHEWVLGLGWYARQAGWLNSLVRYETLYTAFQYIGATGLGHPYMAVGRNLSYPRRYLIEGPGLSPWRDSLSGDDDLMVNAYAPPAKTAGMIRAGSRTWSEAPQTWGAWLQQKTRHVSASHHYSLITKGLLAALHLSHLVCYGVICLSLLRFPTLWSLWGLYLMTTWLKASLLYGPAHDMGERGLLKSLLGLELSYFLYNLSVVPLGLIKRPEWTNRSPKYPKTPRKTGSWYRQPKGAKTTPSNDC
jgi:hypothetical protein